MTNNLSFLADCARNRQPFCRWSRTFTRMAGRDVAVFKHDRFPEVLILIWPHGLLFEVGITGGGAKIGWDRVSYDNMVELLTEWEAELVVSRTHAR